MMHFQIAQSLIPRQIRGAGRLKPVAVALIIGLAASLNSTMSLAHYPLMNCEKNADTVRCETGFSDGTLTVTTQVTVLDYGDQVLLQLKTDEASAVQFSAPSGEYYIRFDSGHESPVEIDYDEL